MTPKIENLENNLLIFAVLRGHFRPFWGQKSRSLDFFKVVLEYVRKFLSIAFGLKRPTFGCNFSSKGS